MSGRVQLSTTLDGVVDYSALLGDVKEESNQNQEHRENAHDESQQSSNMSNVILEQDRFMPIANINRIMKRVLPERAKLSKEAKECIQECVTEFFLFITSEAAEKCNIEKRKTITGEDLLNSMETLGFDTYLPALKLFMKRYREANKAERGINDDISMEHEEEPPPQSVQSHVFTVTSPQIQPPRPPVQVYQNPVKPPESKQSQNQDKHDLPPNFKRADIFIDTNTMQHYIFVETGYIPIEIRAISNSGQIPQPMPLHSFRNSQN